MNLTYYSTQLHFYKFVTSDWSVYCIKHSYRLSWPLRGQSHTHHSSCLTWKWFSVVWAWKRWIIVVINVIFYFFNSVIAAFSTCRWTKTSYRRASVFDKILLYRGRKNWRFQMFAGMKTETMRNICSNCWMRWWFLVSAQYRRLLLICNGTFCFFSSLVISNVLSALLKLDNTARTRFVVSEPSSIRFIVCSALKTACTVSTTGLLF